VINIKQVNANRRMQSVQNIIATHKQPQKIARYTVAGFHHSGIASSDMEETALITSSTKSATLWVDQPKNPTRLIVTLRSVLNANQINLNRLVPLISIR